MHKPVVPMPAPIHARLFLAALTTLSGAACRAPESLESAKPCSGQVTVTVSSGTTPSISWSPVCTMNRLEVLQINAPVGQTATAWSISSPTEFFAAPIFYGVTPTTAVADVPERPLESGKTYEVDVSLAGGEAITLARGQATFTP